ncbi:MAG: hypothetical protein HYS27_00990 [Deltaproteobacteria bacterium]|nr:hypothetical protein [Deltaproteobacteria bacterium]
MFFIDRARAPHLLGPALVAALVAAPSLAVPTGMSPYLYGMHDEPELSLFPSEGGCARGWVTLLEYIGDSGDCAIEHSRLADQGYGVILRLDWGGGPPLPTTPEAVAGYAAKFARCVRDAVGVKVWIVGNEPNIGWGYPYTPAEYADVYLAVQEQVAALPNAGEHEILFAPMSPWAWTDHWGDWDDGLAAAIDRVRAQGGDVDGVAIHAYTREMSVAAVTSDEWFPGREGKWRLHFRGYRDTTELLAARGLFDLPLYITEAGSACDPPCDPYRDEDVGYFVALYEEVFSWNQANPHQVIRAVTPYRWTSNDDGSGRDFCIGCSAPLRQDLEHAVALGRTWDDTGCHSPMSPPPQDDVDGGVPPVDADAGSPREPEPDAGVGPDTSDDDGEVDSARGSPTDVGCACASTAPNTARAMLWWSMALVLAICARVVLRRLRHAPTSA